VGIYTVTKVEK